MAPGLELDQLLIVALTHDTQVLTFLLSSLELGLSAGELGLVDGGIMGSDSFSINVCYHIDEVFFLHREAQRG